MPVSENSLRLLLVEDHRVTLDGLDSWLSQQNNWKVVGKARDSQTAIDECRSLRPDIVLLDLHLPGDLSIEETIKTLSETGAKLIVFSAEDRPHLVRKVMSLGASAYLSKGEDYEVISQVINEVSSGLNGYISRSLRKQQRRAISPAEEQILIMLAKGSKYNDIAEVRSTSAHTIRKQCDRLQLKLSLSSREALMVWAVENGYGADERGSQ